MRQRAWIFVVGLVIVSSRRAFGPRRVRSSSLVVCLYNLLTLFILGGAWARGAPRQPRANLSPTSRQPRANGRAVFFGPLFCSLFRRSCFVIFVLFFCHSSFIDFGPSKLPFLHQIWRYRQKNPIYKNLSVSLEKLLSLRFRGLQNQQKNRRKLDPNMKPKNEN